MWGRSAAHAGDAQEVDVGAPRHINTDNDTYAMVW